MKIITTDQAMGGVVDVMQALEAGEIVCIMGDRAYGADNVPVEFMGSTAFFPYSSFHIASSVHCPVVILLSTKTGHRSYSVDMASVLWPTVDRTANRKDQMRDWVQRYANILGNYLLAHPLQYFIFHDIWSDTD